MQSEILRNIVVDALEDIKAIDLVTIDVRGKTSVADTMVVATGASARQVKALADNVVTKTKEAGVRPMGSEGADAAEWILLDYGDLLVHVMQPQSREFYDLERLWGVAAEARSSDNSSSSDEA